jgi:large subunit ribosomal protein L10
MSKTVKGMIIRNYQATFAGASDAALISIRGMKGTDTTRLRSKLREKKIKITVVQNSLARKAFEGTGLSALSDRLTGSNALAIGPSVVEVAREIVKVIDEFPALELKGALLEGQYFDGAAGVKELSKYPTREEGIGQVVTLVVSPARKLMGQIKGPGSTVAGIIKAIEEKLEKNETIAKAG